MSLKYGKIGRALGLGLALYLGAASQGMAQEKPSDKGQLFQMGILFYGDYNYYMKTGFAPQFLTQQIHPGTQSNNYNSFEITRTYLDFRFTPIPGWTLRVTPNLSRQSNGNLFVRIKYAYLDKKDLFDGIKYFKGDVITAGQEPNPLVGWEEDMYGYRFVNLTPWNFMGLSSTYTGASVHGPVLFHGKQYIDYDIGVFNNASFSNYERVGAKQVMARLSFFPLGAGSRFAGLGLTAFVDNGWTQPNGTNALTASDTQRRNISRMAFLVHYNAPRWGLAAEYDKGRNAVTSGNMFSAQDNGKFYTIDSNLASVAADNLEKTGASQQGYAFFGHYDVPARLAGSGWAVFGMFQHFEPNTDSSVLNFNRYSAGVSYKPTPHLTFALDYQDFHYTNKSKLEAAGVAGSALADTQAVFFHVRFKNLQSHYTHAGF